jgi:FkbM family methyltransferase
MKSLLNLLNIDTGERVLDVGANVGLFTIPAAEKARPGRVVAVEPEPNNLLALRIRAKNIHNITPIAAAVWNHAGTLELYRSSNSRWHSVKPMKRSRVKKESEIDAIRVPSITVDMVAKAFLGGHVDVLKIAVEGAEVEALEGATNIIPRCRAIAIQCVATDEKLESSINEVLQIIHSSHFKHAILKLGPTWAWVVFLKDKPETLES